MPFYGSSLQSQKLFQGCANVCLIPDKAWNTSWCLPQPLGTGCIHSCTSHCWFAIFCYCYPGNAIKHKELISVPLLFENNAFRYFKMNNTWYLMKIHARVIIWLSLCKLRLTKSCNEMHPRSTAFPLHMLHWAQMHISPLEILDIYMVV